MKFATFANLADLHRGPLPLLLQLLAYSHCYRLLALRRGPCVLLGRLSLLLPLALRRFPTGGAMAGFRKNAMVRTRTMHAAVAHAAKVGAIRKGLEDALREEIQDPAMLAKALFEQALNMFGHALFQDGDRL